MSTTDIIILIILVLSAIWGYRRGIVVQLGSLLAFALAIAACHLFGDAVSAILMNLFGGKDQPSDPAQALMTKWTAECVGHILLFLIVWGGVWLFARTVRYIGRKLCLGFLDSLAGAIFMLLKSGLVISFFVNCAKFIAPSSALARDTTGIGGFVAGLAPELLGFLQLSAS
ncbi:MAG: CvpA family protein [Paramuribaculum sp.]|nr:CvpA family protein [Paramuribaculum sp.]